MEFLAHGRSTHTSLGQAAAGERVLRAQLGPGAQDPASAPRGSTARRSRIDRFMASRKHSHSAADSASKAAIRGRTGAGAIDRGPKGITKGECDHPLPPR